MIGGTTIPRESALAWRVGRVVLPIVLWLWATTVRGQALLERVWDWGTGYHPAAADSIYSKQSYKVERRNAILYLVPTMYGLAHGERSFLTERVSQPRLVSSTIKHGRNAMPTAHIFLHPKPYSPTLYGSEILSPFYPSNRILYRYAFFTLTGGKARITFRPVGGPHLQLCRGEAVVNAVTGEIEQMDVSGRLDMFRFKAHVDSSGRSRTYFDFRFLGNRVESQLDGVMLKNVEGSTLDSIRPIALSSEEQAVVAQNATAQQSDSTTARSHFRWSDVGDRLLLSNSAHSGGASVKLSPILNPQYVSYSHRKGLSYRLKLGARYTFSASTWLMFNPQVGYNFKLHQVFVKAPLQLSYASKKKAAFKLVFATGNRILNASVLNDAIAHDGLDPNLAKGMKLDAFDDRSLTFSHVMTVWPWVDVEAGFVYHQRHSVNVNGMRRFQLPTDFRSYAPMIELVVRPWKEGPRLSCNWEHGLNQGKKSLKYDRWEFDATSRWQLHRMAAVNGRLGYGFYAHKQGNYFMDFVNFRDQNLPEGFDDEWTGQFQLLSSRLYNESRYYLRGNVSFESPFLAAAWLPLANRWIENERVYLSALVINGHRPYSELGYSFTTRYVSLGAFASFSSLQMKEMGFKFTFELFRHW